jgi:hypothetical protein
MNSNTSIAQARKFAKAFNYAHFTGIDTETTAARHFLLCKMQTIK